MIRNLVTSVLKPISISSKHDWYSTAFVLVYSTLPGLSWSQQYSKCLHSPHVLVKHFMLSSWNLTFINASSDLTWFEAHSTWSSEATWVGLIDLCSHCFALIDWMTVTQFSLSLHTPGGLMSRPIRSELSNGPSFSICLLASVHFKSSPTSSFTIMLARQPDWWLVCFDHLA